MAENDFHSVTFQVGGTVISRAARRWVEIGRWDYEGQAGGSRFRGCIGQHGEWSPWMLKRELREWFRTQLKESA